LLLSHSLYALVDSSELVAGANYLSVFDCAHVATLFSSTATFKATHSVAHRAPLRFPPPLATALRVRTAHNRSPSPATAPRAPPHASAPAHRENRESRLAAARP